jgi:hypothetical protein
VLVRNVDEYVREERVGSGEWGVKE